MSEARREKNRSRRVVALSRIDRERLARGEISAPEEAVHNTDAPAVYPEKGSAPLRAVRKKKKTVSPGFTPHEMDILSEVPPHFGKL